jgi:GT2 family glycosyltransferase/tetratricopeptide (TPR) repeat protein
MLVQDGEDLMWLLPTNSSEPWQREEPSESPVKESPPVSIRCLFGPVSAAFAEQHLSRPRQAGTCLAFNTEGDTDLTIRPEDSWPDVCARFPAGWLPDVAVLDLAYNTVPECLWSAPLPLVGLARDWRLLWHYYSLRLADCDLVLADPAGATALAGASSVPVRPALLSAIDAAVEESTFTQARDIDVLLVGNLNPSIHPGRVALLDRLAELARRWRVVVQHAPGEAACRTLLGRARVVIHHGGDSDLDRLVLTAPLAGALLLQDPEGEQRVAELPGLPEAMCWIEHDLEQLVEHFLTHEDERLRLVEEGRQAARAFGPGQFWERLLARIEEDRPVLEQARTTRVGQREPEPQRRLLARCWQASAATRPEAPSLVRDLETAVRAKPVSTALHHALGLAVAWADRHPSAASACAAVAASHFRAAVERDPGHLVARLNLAEALASSGQAEAALAEVRQALGMPEQPGAEPPAWLREGFLRLDFGPLRVGWEHAAWTSGGDPAVEARSKRRLLRWRLHGLAAELSADLVPLYEAALAGPELPLSWGRLGIALASSGQPAVALPHLARTVQANPLDRDAARALGAAQAHLGHEDARQRLVEHRRLLHRVAPLLVPSEPWFAEPAPPADELTSILILCHNQVAYTRLCLESILRHTRSPYELVLVDNGSSDETPAYLEEIRRRLGSERIEIIRNESNLGFPAGCNQALARARGGYLVFLNNDTVVTPGWLDGLIAAMLAAWPDAGLVGPVTNGAPPPQGIEVDYREPEEAAAFAAQRRKTHAGRTLDSRRVTGFCLLTRREVLERTGHFDERFGLGFFDDDDLCVRARQAGFRLLIALDVYIHHFGSRTFRGLGVDTRALGRENFERFRSKWGPEYATGYQWMEPVPTEGQAETSAEATVEAPPPAVPATASASRADTIPAVPQATRRISLSMIVRNEEQNLPACLQSVMDLVDEAVIADTGSTDRTREIAARFGARVVEFPWCDSFAAARNESLRHATGRWVLWLDADDRLDEENRRRLRDVFANLSDSKDACAVKVRSAVDPLGRSHRLLDQVRIFPNLPSVRWDYRVHEQILASVHRAGGRVLWTDVVIDHTGYQHEEARKGKLARNLRLLEMDAAERPDDPYTLFNLGWTSLDLGRAEVAVTHLARSLELCSKGDFSITRKLYHLLSCAQLSLGRRPAALEWTAKGLARYADDLELLFQQATLLWDSGERDRACVTLARLLEVRPAPYFGSADAGLRGHVTRHLLGVWYRQMGRLSEAEVQLRAAVADRANFPPAWLELGELLLQQERWPEVDEVVRRLEKDAHEPIRAALLRGRALIARKEYGMARWFLEECIAREPRCVPLRVLLTHCLLREGRDLAAAEKALRDVLALEPGHQEATRNLELLLRQRGRTPGRAAALARA